MATVCYLALGPLFATPRTANVSFALGIAPFTGDGAHRSSSTACCSLALAMIVSLYPGRLLDNVGGHILAPLKIGAGRARHRRHGFGPPVNRSPPLAAIRHRRFHRLRAGLSNHGHAVGALMFGSIIVTAARSRGVSDNGCCTRYTCGPA